MWGCVALWGQFLCESHVLDATENCREPVKLLFEFRSLWGFLCERCCPVLCFPEFSNALSTKRMFIWLSLSYVFISYKNVKLFLKPWLFCLVFNSHRMCTINVHLTVWWVRNGSWTKFYSSLRISLEINCSVLSLCLPWLSLIYRRCWF